MGLDQRAEPSPARDEGLSDEKGGGVWERIVERENMVQALKRVKANGGAAGIDGMTVGELPAYLKEHWLGIRASLEAGSYRPQPVRRQVIAKPGGGEKLLGIPTVVDRLIQQAVAQVITSLFEEGFSPHSYGFRPGRRAATTIETTGLETLETGQNALA